MKNENKIKNKIPFFVISATLCLCVILLISCFAPLDYFGNASTLSIRFVDNNNGRATYWEDRGLLVNLGVLEHHITLEGPSGTETRKLEPGVSSTSFQVIPGSYTIEVETYLFEELYAAKTQTVEIIRGQNTPVTIMLQSAGPPDSHFPVRDFFHFDSNTGTITGYNNSFLPDGGIVNIPSSIRGVLVRAIENSAFEGNNNILSVIIPNSVTSIGNYAFRNCTNLSSVTIPNTVTSIGSGAFSNTNLTNIYIPSSVTNLGEGVFYGSLSLMSIEVSSNNTVFSSLDGILYDKNQNTLITYPGGRAVGDVTILINITSIGNMAFAYCTNLTGIIIPNSVTYIGQRAFQQCTGLIYITIPDSVLIIGTAAFAGTGITNITIPNSVKIIEIGTFQNTNLTSITIPDSVITIDEGAFRNNSDLTNVTIGNNVTSIGRNAFVQCPNLTSIIIPDSVISIGESAFTLCDSLSDVILGNSVTSIGNRAFWGSLTSITIPESVTSIGIMAFYGCFTFLNDSVTFESYIPEAGFASNAFDSNLWALYFSEGGGPGTYVITNVSGAVPVWTKQL